MLETPRLVCNPNIYLVFPARLRATRLCMEENDAVLFNKPQLRVSRALRVFVSMLTYLLTYLLARAGM